MSSAEANFLFCVGAQKAGTTWLYSYFAAHPQVHVQPVKEIHYFNVLWDPKQIGFREMREEHLASFAKEPALAEAGDIAPTDSARGATSVERGDGDQYEDSRRLVEMYASDEPDHAAYRRLMLDGAAGAKWVADITPDYSVLGGDRYLQMQSAFPGSKFLYLMRDPIQRMWSQIRMRTQWMRNNVNPDATEDFVLHRVLGGYQMHVIDRANYRGTIHALRKLPADSVKYMFYETMFEDANIRDLCDFMGIGFQPGNYHKRVREGGDVSMTPEQYSILKWMTAVTYRAVNRAFKGQVPASWDLSAMDARMPDFLDPSKIHPKVLKRLG